MELDREYLLYIGPVIIVIGSRQLTNASATEGGIHYSNTNAFLGRGPGFEFDVSPNDCHGQ